MRVFVGHTGTVAAGALKSSLVHRPVSGECLGRLPGFEDGTNSFGNIVLLAFKAEAFGEPRTIIGAGAANLAGDAVSVFADAFDWYIEGFA